MIIKDRYENNHLIKEPKVIYGFYKCYICGSNAEHKHHAIFDGHKRSKSEKWGATFALCQHCHEMLHNASGQPHRHELEVISERTICKARKWDKAKWYSEFNKFYDT